MSFTLSTLLTHETVSCAPWWVTQKKNIDMSPTYQRRGNIWSDADKAYLIDTILNDYDIPKIYRSKLKLVREFLVKFYRELDENNVKIRAEKEDIAPDLAAYQAASRSTNDQGSFKTSISFH
jgi:hypothetical protein